jgi:hypothetical protein
MSDNDNSGSLQRTANYQRRSVSVGDSPIQMVADDEPETFNGEDISDYNQYITKCDDNGYVCAPLPRSNNRPIAKTCWLVFMFSSPRNALFP